jgi:histidine ammonia-lyase/tyrosine ammonia-lyase
MRVAGEILPSREVLDREGLEPLVLGFKEGLTFINGTSTMTGIAALALVEAERLLRLAVFLGGMANEVLAASTRAFDVRGHELKHHSGQIRIARALGTLLEDSDHARRHDAIMRARAAVANDGTLIDTRIYLQHAYSLRCVPQILGPVLETIEFVRRIVEEELNSCNDNPIVFEEPEDTFHGGNFHGQYVAMACDYLNIALAEIGVLAERQLNRLVDPHLNGDLPGFLAADGKHGLRLGLDGTQYLAASLAAENLDLAAPSSIKSIPSNGANQDVVSMGTTSARKSLKLGDHVGAMLGALAAACHQGARFLNRETFGAAGQQFNGLLERHVDLYRDDIPSQQLHETVRAVLASPDGDKLLATFVGL